MNHELHLKLRPLSKTMTIIISQLLSKMQERDQDLVFMGLKLKRSKHLASI